MNHLLKQVLLVACMFALTGQAIADSFSDAADAFKAGDYTKAARLFRPWAEQGRASAQYVLGTMYRNGEGVPQNDKEAVKWFRLSAAQGTAYAQSALGGMYSDGKGVPQNNKEAAKWYRLAADQGLADAQRTLGHMYSDGKGVPQDNKEAAKWYRLAAEQGEAFVQFLLGMMYEDGRGVSKDYVLSHMWLNIAAANTNDGGDKKLFAGMRDSVAERMTAQQIEEAQGLAKKCTANKFKGC